MNTANEKFSVINLDMVGRVFPSPSAGRLEVADLLHWVGKARQFGDDEVAIPPAGADAADSVYVTILRRRRR